MADRSVRITLAARVGGFQAAMKKAQASVQQLHEETGKASQTQAWSTASTGLLAFGATAVSVGVMAAKSFADFDSAMSEVAAATNTPKESLGELNNLAMELGAKTKFSATEAANGITELAKAGMSTSDIMGGALAGSLDLAATDNLSVADAAGYAATTLTQFGLAGSEASHVADVLAAGAGKAMGSVTDMAEALNNGGLVASQMGMSLEETTGTLAAFAQNGIVGAEAGTQLKTVLQRLQNPAADAKSKMDELGVSAYDAQGKFVGLDAVAGQLQAGTKGLTQAQRDQAMAMIFGSHAISGANVLLKEGASGIADWTSKVNDQGYASEVAAAKMDNLKGDLEQLGGAWETLMISVGGSSDVPLRAIVQNLTDIANFFSDHSGLASGIIGITTALGGFALVAGGIMKATTAAAEFSAAVKALNGGVGAIDSIKKAASGMTQVWTNLSGAQRAQMVGFSALMMAAPVIGAQLNKLTGSSEDVAQAMAGVESGSRSAADAFAQLDKEASKGYMGTVNFGQSIKDAADPGPLDGLFAFLGGIVNIQTTSQKAEEKVGALDDSLAKMVTGSPKQAAEAMSQLKQRLDDTDLSADQIVDTFGNTTNALRDQAAAAGVTGLSNQELADWMRGTVPPAVAAGQAAQLAGKAYVEAGASAEQQTASLQGTIDAMTAYANAALKTSGSTIGLEAAIDDATAAVQKNGATLDLNTEAGRSNQTALNGIASSALSLRDAQMAQDASTETMAASTNRAREQFVQTAIQMGMNSAQANDLANQYGLIPAEVTTSVSAPGVEYAKYGTDQFHAALMALPASKRSEIQALIDQGKISEAEEALNTTARDRTATIFVNASSGGGGGGGGAGGWATGGYIAGPGTATSDSIPARLSNGEFVQRAAATSYYGARFMHALNNMAIPKEALPHFAEGGQVGGVAFDRTATTVAPQITLNAPATQAISPQAIARAVAVALPAALHGTMLTLTPDGRTAMGGYLNTKVAGFAQAASGRRDR